MNRPAGEPDENATTEQEHALEPGPAEEPAEEPTHPEVIPDDGPET